ncbi:hypothetical protein GCM10020229_51800 [Kitasatospora albolonga]|uniref:transglycosylase family protein n=1 Tax=Kitasatospora albolonga TaxID=68173 RepID=UPI0031ECC758
MSSRTIRPPRWAVALALSAAAVAGAGGSAQAASVATWDKVAACESGGNWSIVNSTRVYYGGLQITLANWSHYKGTDYAPRPDLATKKQQILIAEKILADQGPRAWLSCLAGTGLATDRADPYPPAPGSGAFFHAGRQPGGAWSGLGALNGVGGAPFFSGSEAAIAGMPDGSAQVVGIGNDGNVYHEVRLANGRWTGFAPLGGVGTAAMPARKVAIAALPDGSSQVLAVGSDGNVYHESRLSDGRWTGFAPLDGVGAPMMQASDVAIAGLPDGTAQVLAVGNDGNVYHESRLAGGAWTGFAPLDGAGAPTMQASDVAIAGLPDGSSQVLAVGGDGNVYHESRLSDGRWTGFAPLDGAGTPTMQASDVAVAGLPDGSSQVLAVGNDGNVYHQVRRTDATWSGFRAIAGYDGAPTFNGPRAAITALPDGSTQILAIGR